MEVSLLGMEPTCHIYPQNFDSGKVMTRQKFLHVKEKWSSKSQGAISGL